MSSKQLSDSDYPPCVDIIGPKFWPQLQAVKDLLFRNEYFQRLQSDMTKEALIESQFKFFHAVDFFSRPMLMLCSRLPHHHQRISLLKNILEEHGDFQEASYHSNTFKQLLAVLTGNTLEEVEARITTTTPSSTGVIAFNQSLMDIASNSPVDVAFACFGIIEFMFAHISAYMAKTIVDRGFLPAKDVIHYNLHADLDLDHAQEFFNQLNTEKESDIQTGLLSGFQIFNELYSQICA